ncbi:MULTISPECIES: hypothetical protein [unclassified Micromonospora]|uniref:hypothetical protein n=1 Tax=unclassified Micromonospora TaxID=2617518 RepID=UPI0035AFF7C4
MGSLAGSARRVGSDPSAAPGRRRRHTRRAAPAVRGLPPRCRVDARTSASPGLVVAEVAVGVPLRCGPSVPEPPPRTDQSRSLAVAGGPVTTAEQAILAVHVRGLDGMCVGCRLWWARLTPYPCWQVAWATSRQARASVARFLGVRG